MSCLVQSELESTVGDGNLEEPGARHAATGRRRSLGLLILGCITRIEAQVQRR
jgi:hypothetical protein